jgi:hypothetical protein
MGRMRNSCRILVGNLKVRDCLKNWDEDGRIILIFKKRDIRICTGFICLMTSGELS